MNTFGWRLRLKYAMVAGGVGWLVGWLVSFPFELSLAWRYVDGDARRLPQVVAEGLVVWGGFSLFMGMAGFFALMLPCFLLIPPRWIVRWRGLLIPAAALAGFAGHLRADGVVAHLLFASPRGRACILLYRA